MVWKGRGVCPGHLRLECPPPALRNPAAGQAIATTTLVVLKGSGEVMVRLTFSGGYSAMLGDLLTLAVDQRAQ